MEMSSLTRDGTAEPVSRDQILRRDQGKGNINFPCSTDHEKDWQPYPFDPYSAVCDDRRYIVSYVCLYVCMLLLMTHTFSVLPSQLKKLR